MTAAGSAPASLPGAAVLDDPRAIRHAGRDLLSLALIDARNHLLLLMAAEESAVALRLALQAGWYAEYWICRHVQRQRGEACDASAPRLAGIEPRVDGWLAAGLELPAPDAVRAYLAETLEITLDLLGTAAEDDDALHHYRMALLHEDRLCESLAEALQLGAPTARADREPLWLPAQRMQLGTAAGAQPYGLVPHNERWAHEVAVPEFEIDAQVVSWARYAEFCEDRGYDRQELWTAEGWQWLQQQGRRSPGHVEQVHGAVLAQRRAAPGQPLRLARVPLAQPVMHVSRHEAQAWCRWAGRRLPTEPEWELAAQAGERRGFAWGEVFEWVSGSARLWPGAGDAAPGALDTLPAPGSEPWGVLRGGSFATRRRRAYAQARRFMPLQADAAFCGFRSCAV